MTLNFAVVYEINKVNSFVKQIKKLEIIQAKVTVISKTLM